MLSKIYSRTVKPITVVTSILSVYTCGYDRGAKDVNHIHRVYAYMLQSLIVGYCIGITYPISIPGFICFTKFVDNDKN